MSETEILQNLHDSLCTARASRDQGEAINCALCVAEEALGREVTDEEYQEANPRIVYL